MPRTRKYHPVKQRDGSYAPELLRTRKVTTKQLNARRRELLKAGYLEKVRLLGRDGRVVASGNEISRLDNNYEAGLLALTIRQLKKTNILRGRRNHIKKIKRDNPNLSDKEARLRAARVIFENYSSIGKADDYIDYYYNRYR